jgi:hypothetical protein
MAGYQPRHDTDPVWFNGTQINTLDITSAQAGVRVTAVHGWDDRPDVRDVREQRAGQDGEYADNLYLGGRTITIEGEVYGSTWANLQSRKRTLAATFIPTSDEVLLKIPDPATASPTTSYSTTGMTGYERVSCRVIEAIQFGDTLDPCCQTFQVILRASDPRIYSDVETSTDSGTTGTATRTVTVDQTGTYETPVDLTITGPTAATWSITSSDDALSLLSEGLALASTETFEFHTDDRLAIWNAEYHKVRTARSDFLSGWRMNETSGTTAEDAGASNRDLTYNGGFTLDEDGPAASVPSVLLNGSTGYLSRAYTAALSPATFTYECWFKLASTQFCLGDQIDNTTGVNLGWEVYGDATQITFACRASSGSSSATSVTFDTLGIDPTAEFMHVVAVFGPAEQTYYVNGRIVGSDDHAFTPATAGAFEIGRRSGSSYSHMYIGPTFMYGAALVTSEVEELYEATDATAAANGYTYLEARRTRWANLGTASTTYSLASSGLNTGSKLNVTYRDARL